MREISPDHFVASAGGLSGANQVDNYWRRFMPKIAS
jgi:hypothetical protein